MLNRMCNVYVMKCVSPILLTLDVNCFPWGGSAKRHVVVKWLLRLLQTCRVSCTIHTCRYEVTRQRLDLQNRMNMKAERLIIFCFVLSKVCGYIFRCMFAILFTFIIYLRPNESSDNNTLTVDTLTYSFTSTSQELWLLE